MQKPTIPARLALALFLLVRGLIPKGFSARFGAAMEETFLDGLDERRGLRRATFVARSLLGLFRTAAMEWISPTFQRWPPSHPRPTSPTHREGAMSSLAQDIRHTLRMMVHQPSFTAFAVLTIALGIGANTTIFSIVDGVLLRPLPYPDADRIVVVGSTDPHEPHEFGTMSLADMQDVAGLPAMAGLVGFRSSTSVITGHGPPQLTKTTSVSDGLLRVFGLRPLVGRDLSTEDAGPEGLPLAVISHRLWQEGFGESTDAVGSFIELEEVRFEIVGVAPPGFGFPEGTDVWRPERLSAEDCSPRGCRLRNTVGTIADGASLTVAETQVSALGERLALEFPDSNHGIGLGVKSLQEVQVSDVKTGLWVLIGGVGLLLLIACCNVAILLLVRANGRRGEIATRVALGASRGRVIRQILLENQILAITGASIGIASAYMAVAAFRKYSAHTIPRIESVSLDGRVLAFSVLVTLGFAFLVALAPILSLSKDGMIAGLRSTGAGRDEPKSAGHSRNVLLSLEVAMSVLLLTGSGLFLKTFNKMFAVDLGYRTEQIVRFSVALPATRYSDLEQINGFYRSLEERIGGLPGVESVGSVFGAPLGPNHYSGWVRVEGRPELGPEDETFASVNTMTPGFFEAMGIRLLEGRSIAAADVQETLPVAVVNESFVKENFPGEDPLGKEIYVAVGYGYAEPGWTVVGVVQDIRSRSLVADPSPEIYVAQAQYGPGFMTVTVRIAPQTQAPTNAIRSEVLALDPNVPMRNVETLREVVGREVAPTRLYLALIVGFAGVAVFLTAVGLYGVVAYLVSRRTREIGIRMALGVRGSAIIRQVSIQGLLPAFIGMTLGLAVSVASARLLASLLFEVTPQDPWVLLGASGLVMIVASLASLIPALKALRVDPVTVMRAE